MRLALALAGVRCERGEAALLDANVTQAISHGAISRHLLERFSDRRAAGLYVRASVLQVDGLALADRLTEAFDAAISASIRAGLLCRGGRWEALAAHRLNEVREMRGEYLMAAKAFAELEEGLVDESWASAMRLSCCNHLISIGVHSCAPHIAELGVQRGSRLRAQVHDPDEVAAWLQWRGIYESRRGRAERAIATFRESFSLRATTRRRQITRGFLETEIDFAEHGQAEAAATLRRTLARAHSAGLTRHARAGAKHMSRLVQDG